MSAEEQGGERVWSGGRGERSGGQWSAEEWGPVV